MCVCVFVFVYACIHVCGCVRVCVCGIFIITACIVDNWYHLLLVKPFIIVIEKYLIHELGTWEPIIKPHAYLHLLYQLSYALSCTLLCVVSSPIEVVTFSEHKNVKYKSRTNYAK